MLPVGGVCCARYVARCAATSRIVAARRTCLSGHFDLSIPLSKTALLPLLQAIHVLKTVQAAFDGRAAWLATASMHACRHIALQIRRILAPVKARLEGSKRLDDAALDRLAAATLSLQCTVGPPTPSRLLLLQLSLHVAQLRGTIKDAEDDELRHLLWKLSILADWQV